ncbi:hypothetical protein [Streptomyces sp. HNS054]|uniref:hypothetical protein n=1 Tax=Streptomyces sp. HNS054 TaxID=1662446 RepID=UPI000653EB7D|nr:hypothetical protein [Streptomyces sp. HNS054]WPW17547.1 hypothetical protein UBV09_02015 [Streptomyces griseoincarnatus]
MPSVVVALVLLAGLSEAAGRILPLVARRPRVSPPVVAGLLFTGTAVESAVIALWPLTAFTLAELLPYATASGAAPGWTAGHVAPMLLGAVIAFPLLGPALHLMLLTGVGAGLAGPVAAASGVGGWSAAACVAAAGVGLAAAVEAVRRLVGRIGTTGTRRRTT